jgi:hypothetical protein
VDQVLLLLPRLLGGIEWLLYLGRRKQSGGVSGATS